MKSPPAFDCRNRVPRFLRSSVLRLQQIDVSATRDIERVAVRTDEAALFPK